MTGASPFRSLEDSSTVLDTVAKALCSIPTAALKPVLIKTNSSSDSTILWKPAKPKRITHKIEEAAKREEETRPSSRITPSKPTNSKLICAKRTRPSATWLPSNASLPVR